VKLFGECARWPDLIYSNWWRYGWVNWRWLLPF